MEKIFFQNWESIVRTLIITVLAYPTLILMLRISGKRTLSKMNAFDFIVTVALGSCLATVALSKDVAYVDGIFVFFLLIFLQFIITWLSVRVKRIKKLVTDQPTLLFYKGEPLTDVLKKERITMEELFVAARESGTTNFQEIDAIVLETTGTITVIPKIPEGKNEAMKNVKKYPY